MLERLLSWLARVETRQQLSALDDRQLADIGLERGVIDDVAREMSERKTLAAESRWTALPSFHKRTPSLAQVMRGA